MEWTEHGIRSLCKPNILSALGRIKILFLQRYLLAKMSTLYIIFYYSNYTITINHTTERGFLLSGRQSSSKERKFHCSQLQSRWFKPTHHSKGAHNRV